LTFRVCLPHAFSEPCKISRRDLFMVATASIAYTAPTQTCSLGLILTIPTKTHDPSLTLAQQKDTNSTA